MFVTTVRWTGMMCASCQWQGKRPNGVLNPEQPHGVDLSCPVCEGQNLDFTWDIIDERQEA